MIKGTVIGPVVTPPESKAIAQKSGLTKNARANGKIGTNKYLKNKIKPTSVIV
jgi:hypothetical protein